MQTPTITLAPARRLAQLVGIALLGFGAIAALAPRVVHAQAGSVITQAPDPNHPILSQAFQDATDRGTRRPLTAGNRFELLENGVVSFPKKLALVRGARATIFVSSMLAAHDQTGVQLADALVDAVGRGVSVRAIFDGRMVSRRLVRRLRRGGVKVVLYNPWIDWIGRKHRQHRKMVIVDFRDAITGGTNIADAYNLGDGQNDYYKDTDVRVEGDAAAEMARSFLELYADLAPWDPMPLAYLAISGAWSQLVPASPAGRDGFGRWIAQDSDLGDRAIRDYYVRCVDAATTQVLWHVNNPLPPAPLLDAFSRATRRGVRVVILTNSLGANMRRNTAVGGFFQYWYLRLFYHRRVARTGAEIWEINVPIHSKAMTIDGVMASVGSYNLSTVSDRNIEGTLIGYDPAFVREVESMFARDLARSKRVR